MKEQILKPPFFISERKLPAVKIGDVTISIEDSTECPCCGKPQLAYHIDGPAFNHFNNDLRECANMQEAVKTLLAYLEAAADGENLEFFPEAINKWAAANKDEINRVFREVWPYK